MKSKTIYIFANSYKPVLGGVQTVASQFAEGCRRRGYRTIVITNLYPRYLRIYERISQVPVIRLPFANADKHIKICSCLEFLSLCFSSSFCSEDLIMYMSIFPYRNLLA